MSEQRVSAVVVTWNSAKTIHDCLSSLADATSGRVEIIVVDNASSDGTVDIVRSEFRDAVVIANRDNRGLAAGNNQGIVASNAELVLISNPDVIFQAGAVDALVDVLDRRPRAGMVFPQLLHEDGRIQTTAGDLPTLRQALAGRQASSREGGSDSGFWWYGWAHDDERRIGHAVEAAYLVRRAAIAEVGPQDERYVLDWEGLDWADRFARCGWELWFTPRAKVVHLGGVSVKQVPYRWIVRSNRGLYRYFADRRPYLKPVLAPVVAARVVAKAAVQLVGRAIYDRAHDTSA